MCEDKDFVTSSVEKSIDKWPCLVEVLDITARCTICTSIMISIILVIFFLSFQDTFEANPDIRTPGSIRLRLGYNTSAIPFPASLYGSGPRIGVSSVCAYRLISVQYSRRQLT